jgi:hypothetical protein
MVMQQQQQQQPNTAQRPTKPAEYRVYWVNPRTGTHVPMSEIRCPRGTSCPHYGRYHDWYTQHGEPVPVSSFLASPKSLSLWKSMVSLPESFHACPVVRQSLPEAFAYIRNHCVRSMWNTYYVTSSDKEERLWREKLGETTWQILNYDPTDADDESLEAELTHL